MSGLIKKNILYLTAAFPSSAALTVPSVFAAFADPPPLLAGSFLFLFLFKIPALSAAALPASVFAAPAAWAVSAASAASSAHIAVNIGLK